MDIPSFQDNLEISRQCEFIIPSFGIHPWNAHRYSSKIEEIDENCSKSLLFGEIGLDQYFVEDSKLYKDQQIVFEFFLQRARQENKLVIIHTKGAESEVFEILKKYNYFNAIIHWYSGPIDTLKKRGSKGLDFSVGIK